MTNLFYTLSRDTIEPANEPAREAWLFYVYSVGSADHFAGDFLPDARTGSDAHKAVRAIYPGARYAPQPNKSRGRKYRGKYPNRINSVSSVGGMALIETNKGDRFSVYARDNEGVLPIMGYVVEDYARTDADGNFLEAAPHSAIKLYRENLHHPYVDVEPVTETPVMILLDGGVIVETGPATVAPKVHRDNVEWHKGRDAFRAGAPLSSNPYSDNANCDDSRFARWALGWNEAREAAPAPYAIRLEWNGTQVLQGTATLVTACETARAFIAGNFAGSLVRPYVDNEFRLQRIADLIAREGDASGVWDDSTGKAKWSIAPTSTGHDDQTAPLYAIASRTIDGTEWLAQHGWSGDAREMLVMKADDARLILQAEKMKLAALGYQSPETGRFKLDVYAYRGPSPYTIGEYLETEAMSAQLEAMYPEILERLESPSAVSGAGVAVSMPVSWDVITNAFTGALEGGSTYWINSVSYVGDRTGAKPVPEWINEVTKERGHVAWGSVKYWSDKRAAFTVFHDQATTNGPKRKTITHKEIISGLNVMASKFARHFADLINENDDATTHDVFMQCCIFGDIIFG